MFWKIESKARAFTRRSTIATRLTLLYTSLTCILLFFICLLLYKELLSNLQQETNQFLTAKIRVLQHTLQETPFDFEDLKEELSGPVGFTVFYGRIVDTHGKVLLETPGMQKHLPASMFEAYASQAQWKSWNGKVFRLSRAVAEGGYRIDAAMDVSAEQNLLASYRQKLLVVLLFGSLLAGVMARWIAHRAMKPLRDIAVRAQEITASRLSERIRVEDWPGELQILARELNAMLQRLEDAFGRLVNFSSELAHELRTPINNLMGQTEVVLLQPRKIADYKEVLESNLEEYKRIFRMIDNLLFLSRAEDAETILKPSVIDVAQEAEAVREFFEAVADEHQVRILCEGSATLRADPILFRRALSNLVSNSLQFTPAGGTIKISVLPNGPHAIQVSVSDTGCGISEDLQTKAFERFYRTEVAKALYPQGVGLGLTIVSSIMKLHHGKVTLQNESSGGTRVLLEFPAQ